MFFRFDEKDVCSKFKEDNILAPYVLEMFSPSWRELKKHQSHSIMYLFWFFSTRGRYKIVYLYDGNKMVHYSHLLPKFFKLSFMDSEDLMIGPSWTREDYRGKGIFPAIIISIIQNFKKEGRIFHIFTHKDNLASQKAITKACFHKWGRGKKTKKLGIYKVEKTWD